MLESQQMKNTKSLTVTHNIYQLFFRCCGKHVQASWVRSWWFWGCSMFLTDIQSVYLTSVGL